jgi:hypothetical protein
LFFDQGEKKRTIKTQYADALKHWLADRWNDENKMYALIHYSISKRLFELISLNLLKNIGIKNIMQV